MNKEYSLLRHKIRRKILGKEWVDTICMHTRGCEYSAYHIDKLNNLRKKGVANPDNYCTEAYSMLRIRRKRIPWLDDVIDNVSDANVAFVNKDLISFKRCEENIINRLNSDIDLLIPLHMLELMKILRSSGLMAAANIVRNKAGDAVRLYPGNLYHKELLGYLFECGKYDKALLLLEKSSYFRMIKQTNPDDYTWFVYTIKRFLGERVSISESLLSDEDHRFAEYVDGRTVCIVGPGYQDDYNILLKYIDKDDICVMMSYLMDEKQKAIADVVHPKMIYYNLEFFVQLMELEDKSFLDYIDFAPTKSYGSGEAIEYASKFRMLFPKGVQTQLTFHGDPNMLQYCLLDLMFFDTKIKVTNNNMYVAKIAYAKGARPTEDFDVRMKAFDYHDLILNYRITRNMYKAGFFDADDELRRVLEMGEESYVEACQEKYVYSYLQ